MQIKSIYKYARISAFKAREVAREIQGLPVAAALDIIAFSPKKAAAMIGKTLKSAIANAENNANLRVDNLVIKEAIIGEGPTLKRSQPKARGSAGPIRKRTSHIRIVLTDEVEIKPGRKPKSKSAGKKTRAAKGGKPTGKIESTGNEKTEETAAAQEPDSNKDVTKL